MCVYVHVCHHRSIHLKDDYYNSPYQGGWPTFGVHASDFGIETGGRVFKRGCFRVAFRGAVGGEREGGREGGRERERAREMERERERERERCVCVGICRIYSVYIYIYMHICMCLVRLTWEEHQKTYDVAQKLLDT